MSDDLDRLGRESEVGERATSGDAARANFGGIGPVDGVVDVPDVESAAEPELSDIEDRPLREIFRIAAPSVVTMTSYTVMQFIDVLMVSRIGPDPVYVSAAGNGGIVAWLTMGFMLGLTGLVNTFVSQNLGAGKPREGARYAWNGLWLCVLTWVVLCLPTAALVGTGFAAAGHEGELLELESRYAQISLIGAVAVLGARTIAHYFYGMHRPTVVMVAALAGNTANVLLNGVLIFGVAGPQMEIGGGALAPLVSWYFEVSASVAGAFGLPALGVAGAALGTVLGGAVELSIPLALFLSKKFAVAYGTRAAWRPDLGAMKDLFRLGWPAGVMFVNEIACWSFLMAVLLPMAGVAKAVHELGVSPDSAEAIEAGVVANTAGWIGLRYMHVSFMPAVGFSIAMTAIVGKCMGMGRPDLAASRSWLGLRIAVVYMGCCALIFLLGRKALIGFFIPDEMDAELAARVVTAGSGVLIAGAVFQLFDAIAIMMSGSLRGAGDTVWPGVMTAVTSWVFIAGLGWGLIHLAPGLGATGPWIGGATFIIVLGVLLLLRFRGGKWRTMGVVKD